MVPMGHLASIHSTFGFVFNLLVQKPLHFYLKGHQEVVSEIAAKVLSSWSCCVVTACLTGCSSAQICYCAC